MSLPGLERSYSVCGSLNLEESRAKAETQGVARVARPRDIIADPDIEAILNLTIPAAVAEVCLAMLETGKHVYFEKPLVSDLTKGRRVLNLAASKGTNRR